MEALQKELELARVLPEDGGTFDVVLENEGTDVAYADIKNLLAKKLPAVRPRLPPTHDEALLRCSYSKRSEDLPRPC